MRPLFEEFAEEPVRQRLHQRSQRGIVREIIQDYGERTTVVDSRKHQLRLPEIAALVRVHFLGRSEFRPQSSFASFDFIGS